MHINVKVEDIIYEVVIEDINSLPVIAHIGNESFEIWPELLKEPTALPHKVQRHLSTSGMQSNHKDRIVPAPLPGTVIDVFIHPGQKVEEGDPMLIIEAMKMKNTIRSGRSGTIAAIHVQTGEAVKHHQSMIEFSE